MIQRGVLWGRQRIKFHFASLSLCNNVYLGSSYLIAMHKNTVCAYCTDTPTPVICRKDRLFISPAFSSGSDVSPSMNINRIIQHIFEFLKMMFLLYLTFIQPGTPNTRNILVILFVQNSADLCHFHCRLLDVRQAQGQRWEVTRYRLLI